MSDLNDKINEFTNTPDTTAEYDPEDIEKSRVISVFAYLSWLVIIPLIAGKDSKFAKFHVNQGLVLAIVEIACSVITGILKDVPIVGFIFSIASSLIGLACLILAILGIINAVSGKAKELPIIGKIKLLK
ncbi:MAG: hypothetical protein MJ147_01625 [Clostridia bacterium]|nr:hypothetical protein [Clostridia bacterium]